jgi:thiol-disulfide isomerase/thioredoxin
MKVIKFGAVWCSGCLVMGPRWKEIEKDNPWLVTEYYDVDEQYQIAEKYLLTDYPAFIFLDKKGQEINRLYGEVEKKELIKLIEKYKDH